MLYSFNLIRALAVVFVIIGHYLCECHKDNIMYKLSLHTIAMGLFFTISGFLIYQSAFNSNSMATFIKRRIFRILPSIVALSISFTLLWCILKYFNSDINYDAWHPKFAIRAITLSGDLFGNLNIYGIDFWSLHTEFRFYIMVFLAMIITRRFVACFGFIIGIFAMVLTFMYYAGLSRNFSYPMWNWFCISYILFGILAYLYYNKIISRKLFLISYILLYCTIITCNIYIFKKDIFIIDGYFIGIIIATLIILYGKNLKENKSVNHIADISYPLYLTHHFCIAKFGFFGILISIIISEILHFVIEKPFIEYSKTSKLSILGYRVIG